MTTDSPDITLDESIRWGWFAQAAASALLVSRFRVPAAPARLEYTQLTNFADSATSGDETGTMRSMIAPYSSTAARSDGASMPPTTSRRCPLASARSLVSSSTSCVSFWDERAA